MTTCTSILLLALLARAPVMPTSAQANPPTPDPTTLVRHAIQNRMDAKRYHRPLRYLLRKTDGQRDTTKDIIETSDGDVARLVAINGQPLSAQANQAELDRLHTLANHPEIQEHRRQREQKDADRVNRLMQLLPDAFLYRYEGMADCAGGPCYRLSFSPNPRFAPPDVEADIFRGMAGEVWIDQAQERLTRLDAHLIANVDFGCGIIGKLDKGGTIQLEQTDIGGHDWELTSLKLNMKGKALMVKSLSFQITEQASHFSLVPSASPGVPWGVDYRKAIELLEKPASAQNRSFGIPARTYQVFSLAGIGSKSASSAFLSIDWPFSSEGSAFVKVECIDERLRICPIDEWRHFKHRNDAIICICVQPLHSMTSW